MSMGSGVSRPSTARGLQELIAQVGTRMQQPAPPAHEFEPGRSVIRVSMLTMMLPQFGVALAAALVDGLVARHVRRACGGHESATRYHQAKNWSVFALIPLTALIWLVAPLRMPVYWIFTPVLFACAWSVWTMGKYYKKYF